MFMTSNVQALSGLDRDTISFIMKNYSELKCKFAKNVKGDLT